MNKDAEGFFTNPVVIPTSSVVLFERPGLKQVTAVPFLDKYTARFDTDGGAVYDGDKLIASIGRLRDLFVAKEYRGQGIPAELIFQWCLANPKYNPRGQAPRTAFGKQAYIDAWEKLKAAGKVQ